LAQEISALYSSVLAAVHVHAASFALMARAAAPPQAGLPEDESLESSDDDEANQLPFPDADSQPPSDEASSQLYENNRKLQHNHQRLEKRKKNFQGKLKAYQRKEMEFVAQMDSHMDEVEQTEHALSLKIEGLSAENHQLRTFNEKRERDNSQLAERLGETTKQCSESETRVQFLVDRIVALLSSGSADQAQTDAVIEMRQREREMLRQLEDTRQQFDEVRQQNGELHSRLTEELSLSRRLQEQLVEVEDRFSTFQTHRERGPDAPAFPGIDSSLPSGLGLVALPSAMGEGPSPLRAGRLGPRTMGVWKDETEAPPDWERQPLQELPPPISEADEANEPNQMEGQSSALGSVPEAEQAPQSGAEDEEEEYEPVAAEQDFTEAEPEEESGPGDPECSADPPAVATGYEVQNAAAEDSSLTRVQQGASSLHTAQPTSYSSSSRPSPRPGTLPKAGASEKPQYSRTKSSDDILLMEQKLRESLDRASFECAVVRVENGVYNFGPNVCAVVELTAEGEVLACQRDGGDWAPIDEFIQSIAQRPPPPLHQQASSSAGNVVPALPSSWPPAAGGSKASPVDNSVGHAAPASDLPGERRLFGPPAKAAQPPYVTGSSQAFASATSPRRVSPLLQGGAASALPGGVSLGQRQAGATPERLRMPGQPVSQAQVLAPGAARAALPPQSGAARVLLSPNAGGAARYGVTTVSPGRQMPSAGGMYQQGSSSPRLQG